MKRRIAAIALLMLFAYGGLAKAATVRGRIEFFGPYGASPMVGALVALCNPGGCAQFRTGYDGMYYLVVLPGIYVLWVNGRAVGNVSIPNVPVFDIAPLRGN